MMRSRASSPADLSSVSAFWNSQRERRPEAHMVLSIEQHAFAWWMKTLFDWHELASWVTF
jgi:hypothetical protein